MTTTVLLRLATHE